MGNLTKVEIIDRLKNWSAWGQKILKWRFQWDEEKGLQQVKLEDGRLRSGAGVWRWLLRAGSFYVRKQTGRVPKDGG